MGPGVALEIEAGRPRAEQQDQPQKQAGTVREEARQVHQQGRAEGDDEGGQPYAAHRYQPGQRSLQLAIAGVEPGETGKEPTAEQLQCQPQGGERQGVAQRRVVAAQAARPQPGRQGEEEGDAGGEAEHEEACQRHRGGAVVMDTDVDPAGAGAERAETVPPAAPQGGLAGKAAQAEIEQGDREDRQRPVVEGRQGQGCERACGECQQVSGPAGTRNPTHRMSLEPVQCPTAQTGAAFGCRTATSAATGESGARRKSKGGAGETPEGRRGKMPLRRGGGGALSSAGETGAADGRGGCRR